MAANSSSSNTEPAAGLTLGVVIVSFNTCALLDRCLVTLDAALDGAGLGNRAEVWVVDNASSDGSADMVRAAHPWVRVLVLDENRGFTAGNNLALQHWMSAGSDGPAWLLLLNPDTEIDATALTILIDALAADRSAGMAGPGLRYPDRRFQGAAFHFPGVLQTWLDLVPIDRLAESRLNGRYPFARYAAGQPFRVDFVLGACMLVRREALMAVGPLDEDFFMYCEEIDWCRRLQAAGWLVLCVPAALVLHHGGASTRQFRQSSFVQLWRSRRRYFAKHGSRLQRAMFEATLRAGLAARSLRERRAVATGRLAPDEAAERAAAYGMILAGPPA